ncbi:carbohydrate porin [Methylobacterium planeticum]|uniref:Outer membrane beta-barrel protein n=1 Tax=Methylobacterium planeticum TaxID=2615211 RepID=A0A6N6MKH5_9HYPH|nr:carbohydrate porin [Methylobacterium planeticum]KAB1070145.1 outer membrane beta-barrel protein [Methylobacterium planeticum]
MSPSSHAADPAAPRAVPAFVDWSGPYLGLQGSAGASFGALAFGPTTIGGRTIPAFKTGDATGRSDRGRDATTAVGGAFGGYNWQSGPWLYGLEADLSGANLKRPVASTALGFGYGEADPVFSVIRAKTDLYGTLRGRLGYSFERSLVYATFGLAGAETRLLASYPDLTGGPLATQRRDLGRLGFTLGAGVQYAISDSLALGLDYRYVDLGRSGRFDLGSVPGPAGGLVSTRVGFTSNQMLARLSWYPGGLGLPAEADEASTLGPGNGETGRFSLHGQTTFFNQAVPRFRSPYRGENSLVPNQAQATTTATAFIGFKLLEGTELYYNPEFSQGFGLSRTLGIAGFVNGEAQKAGAPFPKLRSNRYFVRQTFGLGGESEDVPDGPNQVATRRDIERITVVAGKFALGDFFDGNAYAHDPRIDFMNWSLWASTAWDFPANLPGFTQGLMVEYNQAAFAIRAAYTQVPKEPSNDVLDPRVFRRGGATIEVEERHVLPGLDQPGKIRLGLFSNVGNSANYREVVTLTQAGLFADINDAAAATRRPRRKSGLYLNLEQALTADLGLFARASAADGRNENLSFTDVDRSVSGGLSLKGTAWNRPGDTVGLGATLNGLSPAHRAYFANGGLGLLIGDGRLNYAPERAVEAYYALSLTKAVTVSLNYQYVANPGYNRDRGPASFFGTRIHADF